MVIERDAVVIVGAVETVVEADADVGTVGAIAVCGSLLDSDEVPGFWNDEHAATGEKYECLDRCISEFSLPGVHDPPI